MKSLFRKFCDLYLNRNLRTKFFIIFLCASVLPFIIMGLISVNQASISLSSQVSKQLLSVQGLKKNQIETYFSELVHDIDVFTKSELLNTAMFSFGRAYQYDGNKVGGESWSETNIELGPWLQDQVAAIGLKDVILLDMTGQVLYSQAENALLGISVGDKEYADSALAKAFNQGKEKLSFQDLTAFSNGRKTPVAYVSAPIPNYMAGGVQGVMVAQLAWDRINAIVDERTGMGSTGETLLVGPDHLMRSNSAVDPEHHSIEASFADPAKGSIRSSMVDDALAGQNGLSLAPSYQNTEVFSVFSPIKIHDTQWALLVEISKAEALASVSRLKMMLAGLGTIGLAFIVIVAILFTRSITGPLNKTVETIQALEAGRLDHRLGLRRKDEIGVLAHAMDSLADSLQNEVVSNLEKLATGNLDFAVVPRDKHDKFRGSLQKLCNDLNATISRIQQTGERIAMGSSQVSSVSQSLSQGATTQAASLEQISASLQQMSGQTATNAENANQANRLTSEAQQAAQLGSTRMQAMVTAMQEINTAGQDISKIIKTIDEIAFQTNLLALNAAVEAARAGQQGKGFAVVAEEVRNLAARSAKAAEETAALIQSSVDKTHNGSQIASNTAEALQAIVNGVTKVSDLVEEIAAASSEQAQGIAQINQGVNQVDQVTQQSTASAEESAAAAEELFSQVEQMRQMLGQFVLKPESTTPQLTDDATRWSA